MCRGNTTGLDWTDVARTMAELEKEHSAVVTFTVSQLGEDLQRRFWIGLVVSTPYLRASGQLLSVETCSEWPNGRHETMEALIYALCLKADKLMTDQLDQMGLLHP